MTKWNEVDQERHYHEDARGMLHACYHKCRSMWYIWLPLVFLFQVLLFPLEHDIANWLWEQPGFEYVADYMGWGHEE